MHEIHVDGFRFDLASVLSREPTGGEIVESAGDLADRAVRCSADTKIIAEAWDAAGLYQVGCFPDHAVGRVERPVPRRRAPLLARRAGLVGDMATRLAGQRDLYQARGASRRPTASTSSRRTTASRSTTWSATSTSTTRPTAKDNRDGDDNNSSCNYGVEGPTHDAGIEDLRDRQMRNFMATLLLQPGRADDLDRRRSPPHAARQQQRLLPGQRDQLVRLGSRRRKPDLLRFWRADRAFRRPACPAAREFFSGRSPAVACRTSLARRGSARQVGRPGPGCWPAPSAGQGDEPDLHLSMNMYWEPLDFELPTIPAGGMGDGHQHRAAAPADIVEPGAEQPVDGPIRRLRRTARCVLVSRPSDRSPTSSLVAPLGGTVSNALDFTFSDLVAGYVPVRPGHRRRRSLHTSDGRPYSVRTHRDNTVGEMLRNLGEAYIDATAQLRAASAGPVHPRLRRSTPTDGSPLSRPSTSCCSAKPRTSTGSRRRTGGSARYERIADFYLESEFGGPTTFDFRNYRTDLTGWARPRSDARQETDTISRLVYGLATAYLISGKTVVPRRGVRGARYMVEHLCCVDTAAQIAYWYHAIDVAPDGTERKILASEFGDDYNAIPCYEQIYALAGLTQVTGSPAIRGSGTRSCRRLRLFDRYYADRCGAGTSRTRPGDARPTEPDPRAQPGPQELEQGRRPHAGLPDQCVPRLRRPRSRRSSPDSGHDRQILPGLREQPVRQGKIPRDGRDQHRNGSTTGPSSNNLKIAWNLIRVQTRPLIRLRRARREDRRADANRRLRPPARRLVRHGRAITPPGKKFHGLVWHDRKAWWQQEQGILAYFILSGTFGKPEYTKLARESTAFYSTWILDTDAGGVYFNVQANGLPYLLGNERMKGSHSMSGLPLLRIGLSGEGL